MMVVKGMFILLIATAFFAICKGKDIQITNLESGDIWIGTQTNANLPPLRNGGFVLKPNEQATLSAPDDWQGRIWARTWCDAGTNHCLTGDCGNRLECGGNGGEPPATLVEFNFDYQKTGVDWYDISLVDGFNIKATVAPVNGQSDGGPNSCKNLVCSSNINAVCPQELQVKNGNDVIGCKSACAAFNTDEYCCRNAHNTEKTCKSSDWPKDYPKIFKNQCPDAYSYAYDDQKSLVTCKAGSYVVTFGG